MTRIAIQERLDGKTADWLERSDEQYQAAASRAAAPRDTGT